MRQTKVLSPLPTPPSRETQKRDTCTGGLRNSTGQSESCCWQGAHLREAPAAAPPVREAKYSPSASMPTMYFVFLWKVTITVRVLKMFTYAGQLPTPPEQNAQAPLTSAAKT